MLKVADLSCGYDEIPVLRDIHFGLAKGETLALVGPNGSGKTTLLMAIAGHVLPKSGHIQFEGKQIDILEPNERCGLGIGLVPEGRRIFPDLTVFENLVIGGYSRPKNKQTQNLNRVVEIFPRLLERQKQLAGSLSGGEQQMLAFGRAIMSEPSLLLVDELSLGLMPSVVEECYVALEKLVSKGISVILVDQNIDVAMSFCSTSLVLDTGHQAWYGKSSCVPKNLTL